MAFSAGKQSTLMSNSRRTETTDTLPKAEYYRSLRPSDSQYGTLSNSPGGTLLRKDAMPIFKPSGKEFDCEVVMLDGEIVKFAVDREAYGQQLFEKVCEYLKLSETEFFGIVFRDQAKVWFWLPHDKKILKHIGKNRLYFEFRVKYYPNDVETLQEDLTRYFLCLQVRQDLYLGSLRATFLTYVVLGAYVVQSEAGDHDPGRHIGIEYIKNHQFAPEDRLVQMPDLYDRIAELHKLHRGQSPEEADMNFLLNARKLALYGIDFHKATDSSGVDVELGVYYGGVLIYRNYLRIKRYSWARLIKINCRKKEFQLVVRPLEGEGTQEKLMVFKCRTPELAQRLYQACVDHHRFFRLREQQAPKRALLANNVSRTYISAFNKSHGEDEQRPLPNITVSHAKAPGPKIVRSPTKIGENKATTAPKALGESDDKKSPGLSTPAWPKTRPKFPHDRWILSLPDASQGIGLDDKGLDVASQPSNQWQGIRANKGLLGPGNYYYEATVVEDGPVMIGWSTNDGNMEPVGSDHLGWAVGILPGEGQTNRRCTFYHDDKSTVLPLSILRADDTIGCLLHAKANGDVSLQWTVNGQPTMPQSKPIALPSQTRGQPLFPTISVMDSRVITNFGEEPFRFLPDVSKTHPEGKGASPYIPISQVPAEYAIPNKIEGIRMNPYDASEDIEVAPSGQMIQSQLGKGWQGCRANKGVFGSGKYYYEATPLESGPGALARVGWSTEDASLELGTDKLGFGYGADKNGFGANGQEGKKMHRSEGDSYGAAYYKEDTIGCFIDLQRGSIQWAKNGKEFGEAFRIPSDLLKSQAFFPTASVKDNTIDFNFGERAFKYPPKDPSYLPMSYAPSDKTKFSRKRRPQMLRQTEAAQPKRRPILPEEHWALLLPDASLGLGLDEHGLDAASQPGAGWQGIRSNKGLTGAGNYYYEATILEDGPVMIGWATNFADIEPVGCDEQGVAIGILPGEGQKSQTCVVINGNQSLYATDSNGAPRKLQLDDVVGCLIHRRGDGESTLQWSVNGQPLLAPSQHIRLPDTMKGEPVFPAVSMLDNRVEVNFGDAPFRFPPETALLHPDGKSATPYLALTQTPSNSWVPNVIESWRMNPLDATKDIDIGPNGKGLQSHLEKGWQGCRANKGVSGKGKYYYEVTPLEESPEALARVGWSTLDGSLDLGSDKYGFAYGADNDGFGAKGDTGKKLHRAESKFYGKAFTKDDVIGCFIDLEMGVLQWSKNGEEFGEGLRIPDDLLKDGVFYPAASLKDNTLDYNFGEHPFKFPPKDSSYIPLIFAAEKYVKPGKGKQGTRPRALKVVQKPKLRPIFPHEPWAFSLADSTYGLGVDEVGLDVASQPGAGWQGIRANKGIKGPGNFYYETTVLEEGPVLIGWTTNEACIEPVGGDELGVALGILPGAVPQDRACVILSGNQSLPAANEENSVPRTQLQVDDIVGCLLHCQENGEATLQWTVNGQPVLSQNKPFKVPDQMRGETLFPAASMLDSRLEVNFGDSPFRFPPSVEKLHPNGKFSTPYTAVSQVPDNLWLPNAVEGWRMNPHDATKDMEVSPSGQMLQSRLGKDWQGCRANKGVLSPGKYYYEATQLEEGPGVLARVGWSVENGSLDLGSDKLGFGYGADKMGFSADGKQGRKLYQATAENYGLSLTKNDTVGCFLDLEKGMVHWAKNGQVFEPAFHVPPELLKSGPFFPTASLKDNTMDFNFGDRPFKYPPQDGTYLPLAYVPSANVVYNTKGPKRLRPSSGKKPMTVRPVFPEQHWVLSLPDATFGLGLDESGLDAASQPGAGWQGIRCNKGLKGVGNFYYEATVIEEGPVMIGWATNEASIEPVGGDAQGIALGIMPNEATSSRTAVVLNNNKTISSGPMLSLQVEDVVGCLLHSQPDSGISLQWTVNGDPVLDVSKPIPLPDQMRSEPLFPTLSMLDSRIEANFGDSPFRFPPEVSLLHPSGKSASPYVAASQAPKECVVASRVEGWRMNPSDATEGLDVAPNGKGLQSHSGKGWQGCRANKGVTKGGKYFYEVIPLEGGPGVLARVGWSTEDASLELGTDGWGFGYGADKDGFGISGQQGKKLHRNDINNYGEAFTKDDAIGCYVDLQEGILHWSKNGKEFGEAYRIPAEMLRESVFYPTASLKDNTLDFNFGEKQFKFPPKDNSFIPVGYTPQTYVKYNPKRGPAIDGRPNILLPRATTEREEDELTNANRSVFRIPGATGNAGDDLRNGNRLSTNQTRTSTFGDKRTVVETSDPDIQTEIYTDEHGNIVRRTIKKTTIRTTTTTRTTERTENQIHTDGVPMIIKTFGFDDDEDDRGLTAAILAVTKLDPDMMVQAESVGPQLDSGALHQAAVESDI